MAWHISQALMNQYEKANSLPVPEAESWEVSSSGKLRSAPSSGTHIALLHLPKDRMTAFSIHSLSGTTLGLLTDSLGEDVLTWFLAGSPVRISAQREKAKESLENVLDSGKSLSGLLAKYEPVESVWRTPQCSLFEESRLYSGTWPRWGTMQNGAFSERMTPGHLTSARGSGLWASPASADSVGSHGGGQGRSLRTDIHNWKRRLWPTPVADGDRTTNYAQGGESLGFVVRTWPTPRTHESGTYQRDRGEKGKERPTLAGAVKFPTPKARDWKRAGGNGNTPDLSTFVHGGMQTPQTYPTPTSVTNSGGSALNKWGGSGARKAMNALLPSEEINGALNPEWVEWLMGWPLGWTDLKPLGTARFQTWWFSRRGM